MKNKNILFVCYGNICRSPSAHGIFTDMVKKAQLSHLIAIDSAGTSNLHEGEPPDPRSQHHAKLRGYDISDLRARSINISDFEKSDLILAMDGNNAEDCRNMCPPIYHSRINLLTSYCRAHNIDAVPDPYYGGKEHFERVLDIVEDACAGLLISLKSDFL